MGPILIAKYPTACKVQVILTQVELMGRIGSRLLDCEIPEAQNRKDTESGLARVGSV